MRNGVLGVIGEVVGQVLNSSEMDEQAKCTRDQLLDKLEVRGCESVWVWVGRGGGYKYWKLQHLKLSGCFQSTHKRARV